MLPFWTRSLFVLLCLAIAPPAWAERNTPNIDTVVVCANELLPAARPWLEYRRLQGHQLALIPGSESRQEVKRAIRAIAKHTDLKFVVLIGDAPANGVKRGTDVDTVHVDAQVIPNWGAEPTFASDNWYADLDEDGVPELAIGRLCADSADELGTIVHKILAYEKNQDLGQWRRRFNLVAGVGGFGALTDKVLETATKKFITDGIPAEYRTSMTHASWRSTYSPDPRRFQAETIERLNQGCLAWVYLGHGRKRALDAYRLPVGGLPILSSQDVPRISCREGSPIAVFLSCYTAAFDAEPDCLGETLLAAPQGPVAVIGGSSVTMPYAMTVMGKAMLHELFTEQRGTLGEVLLHAKRELAREPQPGQRSLIDQLASLLSPQPELLHAERMEHVCLFHLIGDPLLRIRYPEEVQLDVPEYASAGKALQVQGTSNIDGPCVIELVCRRDRLRFQPPRRPPFEATDAWLSELQETYLEANNSVWVSSRQTIQDGGFTANLTIPQEAWGPCHVRVFVQGKSNFGMGSKAVYLQVPPTEPAGERP